MTKARTAFSERPFSGHELYLGHLHLELHPDLPHMFVGCLIGGH